MILPPEAVRALECIAKAMAVSVDPWWIIGSTAVALHGVDPGPIRDIDLLASEQDTRRLLGSGTIALADPAPDARFRSAIFARWRSSPFPVEVMAGLTVGTDQRSMPIRPATRKPVTADGNTIFIPAAAELRAILQTFGRDKDMARAVLLPGGADLRSSA